jgi:hypothetical protein
VLPVGVQRDDPFQSLLAQALEGGAQRGAFAPVDAMRKHPGSRLLRP